MAVEIAMMRKLMELFGRNFLQHNFVVCQQTSFKIIKNKVKTKDLISATNDAVKTAVLEECPPLANCPLIAASVYDTKPFHFLSTCYNEIKWVEKTHPTWDKDIRCLRLSHFLCLCINNLYHLRMGNVDFSDQLQGNYQPDANWIRKVK
jgi:hypothetical protein